MSLVNDGEFYTDGATGDMYYRSSTGLWVAVSGTAATGDVPRKQGDGTIAWEAPPGGSASWTTVIKSADQNRSAVTAVAADSELVIACLSGKTYLVDVWVHFHIANGTMDFKYGWHYTGTTSLQRTFASHSDPGKAAANSFNFEQYRTDQPNAIIPLGSAASDGHCYLRVMFRTTSAGTFSFDWAQNTSDAANATVYGGSYLYYTSV